MIYGSLAVPQPSFISLNITSGVHKLSLEVDRKVREPATNGTRAGCSFCSAQTEFMYAWAGFKLYRCVRCGIQSVDPIPTATELEAYYQQVFYKHNPLPERWQWRLQLVERAFERYIYMWFRATGKGKPQRFLDIGGGLGYYAKAALNRGIESCLMDYSDEALQFGRRTLGISWTVRGNIEKCAQYLEKESFDFVLARHTIEHLRDPREYVENIALVLRRGGLIEIETPNVVSKEQFCHPMVIALNFQTIRQSNPSMPAVVALRHAVTKSMAGVVPPKHLWGFTVPGLSHLLNGCGFEVVESNRAVSGHTVFDPLYYDLYRLSTRKNLGVPYYFWERLTTILFAGKGINLAILARKR
jgi:2-polyprenyl-3-methyl-5-hydroxy-6-metoxy-1,4-benzoquinol methylase